MSRKSKRKKTSPRTAKRVQAKASAGHAGRDATVAWARALPVIALVLLVAAVVWAYAPVADHGTVGFDDPRYVAANPDVQNGLSADSLRWALTSRHAYNWHPLTWWSHMLDVELFGLDYGKHHIVSVTMHAATSLLLVVFFVMTTGSFWSSFAVGSLFALHPAHVESVAWLSERKDVLSAFLFVLVLLAWARYAKAPTRSKYAVALLLFAFGLMAKPMLVTVPFVLLLVDLWPLERGALETKPGAGLGLKWSRVRALVIEKIPFFALTLGSMVLTVWAQRPLIQDIETFSVAQRISNAIVAYGRYAKKLLWPDELSVFYPHVSFAAGVVLSVVLLVAAATWLALRQARKRPWITVGWLWYLGMLVPVLGLLQTGLQSIADRYTYLPSIGFSVIAVWVVAEVVRSAAAGSRQVVAGLLLVAVLIPLTLRTRTQVETWEDDASLYGNAATTDGGSFWAFYNLGLHQLSRGQVGAKGSFEAALRFDPENVESLRHLGNLELEQGDLEGARSRFSQAVTLRPRDPFALRDLATVLARSGDAAGAADVLRSAVEIAPDHPEIQRLYGRALLEAGRPEEAVVVLERSMARMPDDAEAHNTLGVALGQLGRLAEAAAAFRKAVAAEPSWGEARANLARAEAILSRR